MPWTYSEQLSMPSVLQSATPVLIFKHSNRCSISAMAYNRMLKFEQELNTKFDVYLVDVVANRHLSQNIAAELGIEHESPQAIVINQGKVIYASSHMGINAQEILSLV